MAQPYSSTARFMDFSLCCSKDQAHCGTSIALLLSSVASCLVPTLRLFMPSMITQEASRRMICLTLPMNSVLYHHFQTQDRRRLRYKSQLVFLADSNLLHI